MSPLITINPYQSLSILINHYQSLLITINPYQSLSIPINPYKTPCSPLLRPLKNYTETQAINPGRHLAAGAGDVVSRIAAGAMINGLGVETPRQTEQALQK